MAKSVAKRVKTRKGKEGSVNGEYMCKEASFVFSGSCLA